MKKILITGANSYIGTSFEKYMAQWPEQYQVDTVDMIDGSWREKDFSGYDCVYHVAGIVHIKEKRIMPTSTTRSTGIWQWRLRRRRRARV